MKGKLVSAHAMNIPGTVEIYFHLTSPPPPPKSFLTLALFGVSSQIRELAAFLPGKDF